MNLRLQRQGSPNTDYPLDVRGQIPCKGWQTLFGARLGLGFGQVRSSQVRLGWLGLLILG